MKPLFSRERMIVKSETPIIFTLIVLITLAILLASISIYKVPFSHPMPNLKTANELLIKGEIKSSQLPIGYTAFLAICIKLGGKVGVFLAQAILYISTVILGFIFLYLLGAGRRIALLGACVLALHPYLVINIKRIVENNLAVFLLLSYVVMTLLVEKSNARYVFIILWGFLLSLLMAVRPNAISLLGMPFLLGIRDRYNIHRNIPKIFIFLTVVFVVLASISITVTGSSLFLPSHAAHNFFAGANEYTAESLLKYYYAEPGFWKALKAKNITFDPDKSQEALYWKLGLKYISQHPFQYIWLGMLKIITLFRPDYRLVRTPSTINSFSLKLIMQTLMATPLFLWLISVVLTSTARIRVKSWFVLPIVLLYILPFILASADPRYRLPVDIVMILDCVYRFSLFTKVR